MLHHDQRIETVSYAFPPNHLNNNDGLVSLTYSYSINKNPPNEFECHGHRMKACSSSASDEYSCEKCVWASACECECVCMCFEHKNMLLTG